MAAYIVYNKSGSNIEIEITSSDGSRRGGYSLLIKAGESMDILPYAGSIDGCKRITQLKNLQCMNRVEVVCQP